MTDIVVPGSTNMDHVACVDTVESPSGTAS